VRAETEQKLNRVWYENEPPPPWLRLLTPLYRLGNRFDRWRNTKRRPTDLENVPIVIVGNLTVGGAGKTPLVIRLCKLFRSAGYKPGVISRGYGREEKKPRLVSIASDPGQVGDEPLLIARQAGVPVIVASNRCEAARKLLKQGVDIIISDDGLQHYRLPRTMEICVVDGSRGFGNGKMLPEGPLREPLERLGDFDFVVVNGDSKAVPEEFEPVPMALAAGLLRSLDNGQSWRLAQFAGCKVNAVAGIGNPKRFFDLLRQARLTVKEHPFPDHHHFTATDFEGMDQNLPILMTEKDAVKVKEFGLKNAWCLAVEAVLPPQWEAEVVSRLMKEKK